MTDLPQSYNLVTAPLPIFIVVSHNNGLPQIGLRKRTTDVNLIKTIISCAFYGQPIILQPTFSDKVRALATLTEKGIIYREEDKYFFNI